MWWVSLAAIVVIYGIRLTMKSRAEQEIDASVVQRGGRRSQAGNELVRRGVAVRVQIIDSDQDLLTEASARAVVPSGLRFLRRRNWEKRSLPGTLSSMANAAVVERTDE